MWGEQVTAWVWIRRADGAMEQQFLLVFFKCDQVFRWRGQIWCPPHGEVWVGAWDGLILGRKGSSEGPGRVNQGRNLAKSARAAFTSPPKHALGPGLQSLCQPGTQWRL